MSDKLNVQDKDNIKISIPNKAEYVGVVRLTTSAIATRIGFNIEEIDDIKVAIAEGCTLMIEQKNSFNEININYILDNNKITILVNGSKTEKNEKNIVQSNEKGLGLFIIKSLMDEVEFNNNENNLQLKMIKNIEDVAE